MNERFREFAQFMAEATGSPGAFIFAVAVVVAWAVTGPVFAFSDTWQLVINTGTTIVTFLMVFMIQNSQNRDTRAMQLKLDELLRAVTGARTNLVNLEELTDEDLKRLQEQFEAIRARATPNEPGDGGSVAAEEPRRKAS
ncbi:MAG TPA: low affinity iron permease family protein [Chloroflexota bacterium]|nr:low affinity iron permease family protein [Chloroflexota bacterium]